MPEAHRRHRPFALALAALVLAGCAGPPPRPAEIGVSGVYPGGPDELAARLVVVLARYQILAAPFDPTRGVLRAERQDLGETPWQICEERRVRDPDGERLRDAVPLRRNLELAAALEDVGGSTRVTLRPEFIQVSLNTFTNLEVTHRCRSTGELEREILAGLRDGAA